ncbi:colicin release lysis protein [Escherichia coli]|nr:colicin release lysis protein [Escherichia coli]
MILSVFITVISGHDKPQPPGCLLEGGTVSPSSTAELTGLATQ